MSVLRAGALGALAVGVLAYGVVTVFSVVAMRSGGGFDVRLGPIVIAAVERSGESTTTVYGPGLLLMALAGGLLNGAAARILVRRRRARLEDVPAPHL